MLHFNRDQLVNINYLFIGVLMMGALMVIICTTSPEKKILGEWEEVGWYFEKPDARLPKDRLDEILRDYVREGIMEKMEVLHVDSWQFKENGTLLTEPDSSKANLAWSIKGNGHILELRRNGYTLESFQIKKLDRDLLELHLMLDIQMKGIVKIVLKRKDQEENLYAEKI